MRVLKWIAILVVIILFVGAAVGWNIVDKKIVTLREKIEKKITLVDVKYAFFPLQITVGEMRIHSGFATLQSCVIPVSLSALRNDVKSFSLFCDRGGVTLTSKQVVTTGKRSAKKAKRFLFPQNFNVDLTVNHFKIEVQNISKSLPLSAYLSSSAFSARWGDESETLLLSFSPESSSFSVDVNLFEVSFSHKEATVSAKVGGWCRGKKGEELTATCDLYCKEIAITHPTLDATALQLPFLRIEGAVTINVAARHCFIKKGRLSLGSLDGGFTFSCRDNDYDLSLFSNNLRLVDLATLISAPQLRHYRVGGEIVVSMAGIGTISPLTIEDVDITGEVINPTQESDRLNWLFAPFSHPLLLEDGTEREIAVNRLQEGEFLLMDLIPVYLPWSIVLSEDAGFYLHHGVDFAEINQVAVEINTKQRFRGGSTITQQLAKNLFLTRDRTLVRKFKELLLAIEIDATLSKRRQLNIYLSIVEWAPGVYGVEEASEFYFGKIAEDLTVLEAAYLASIISCPTKCSVHFYKQRVPDGWMKRVYRIVELLYQHEKISTEKYIEALNQTILFRPFSKSAP